MKKQSLWSPTTQQINDSQITHFIQYLNKNNQINLKNYQDLHRFSITEMSKFWSGVWDFTSIIGDKGTQVLKTSDSFEKSVWFPEASLNYAENLLAHLTNAPAIISNQEHQVHRSITYKELYSDVSKLVQFFQTQGLEKGDRVGFLVNNEIETVVCVLAITALAAIPSLCSTDFGAEGVIVRFAQIQPKFFIYAKTSFYNGKIHSQISKASQILTQLPSIEKTICINNDSINSKDALNKSEFKYSDILNNYIEKPINFVRVPFNHPLYIVYSSGTTGAPKCIVHGHGGVLLQHKKEHIFHCNIKEGDHVFYYTTCGWMMWQWLVSALSARATLILYQGSPFYPDNLSLLRYLNAQNVCFLGTSAKYIDTLRKEKILVKNQFTFDSLKMIGSTGSPLIPENFEYIYENWKSDVCVASLSGGTDILSCFVLGCPIKPVISGEIQSLGLGMDVDVFDEYGHSLRNTPGELVCKQPFPSMPVYFWNDINGVRYKKSYFEKYTNVWAQSDWATITEEGGCIIYGRSDTTLNPGGVRIGTSEIYRQIEQFDEILESVITEYYVEGDARIVLFVKLRHTDALTTELIDAIKAKIKVNCSPRHVPTLILSVLDIPKTKSGKLMELAVKNLINDRAVNHVESVQNPESFIYFKNVIPNNF